MKKRMTIVMSKRRGKEEVKERRKKRNRKCQEEGGRGRREGGGGTANVKNGEEEEQEEGEDLRVRVEGSKVKTRSESHCLTVVFTSRPAQTRVDGNNLDASCADIPGLPVLTGPRDPHCSARFTGRPSVTILVPDRI